MKKKGNTPTINTLDEKGNLKVVELKPEAFILGATLQNTTSWKAHLVTGEEALLPKIRKKLGLMKHIGKTINKEGKKILAT